jgi:hypothetical protein
MGRDPSLCKVTQHISCPSNPSLCETSVEYGDGTVGGAGEGGVNVTFAPFTCGHQTDVPMASQAE